MNKAVEYERRHGSIALLKACGSALNKLLVSKGIVTESELIAALERGLDSSQRPTTEGNKEKGKQVQ